MKLARGENILKHISRSWPQYRSPTAQQVAWHSTGLQPFQTRSLSRPSPFTRLLSRNSQRKPVQHLFRRRWNSTKPPFNPTPNLGSPEPSLSLSQRLKKLSREYGWSALGVYLLLSALDFPFCFIAVRWLGTERIGRWEHVALEWIWRVIPYPFPTKQEMAAAAEEYPGVRVEEYGNPDSDSNEVAVPGYDHGVEEADRRNQSEDASKWPLP